MNSSFTKSWTDDNATKDNEQITTNPSSESSQPVVIPYAIDFCLTKAKEDNIAKVWKDGFTSTAPIVIEDLDELTEADNDVIIAEGIIQVPSSKTDSDAEKIKAAVLSTESNKKVTVNNNVSKNTTSDISVLNGAETQNVEKGIGYGYNYKQTQVNWQSNKIDSSILDNELDLYETELPNVVILNKQREDSDVIMLDSKSSSKKSICNNACNNSPIQYPPIDLVAEEDKGIKLQSVTQTTIYDTVCKENSLLSELVKKCLTMVRNQGMDRVINRTLLTIYRTVDENYKKSDALRKVLSKTLSNLDIEPELKFSHIKSLCDHLKLHVVKKRVSLISLDETATDNQTTSTVPNKKRRVETIDLENYSESAKNPPQKRWEYPPIEIEDSSSSIEEVTVLTALDARERNVDGKENSRKKKKKKRKRGKASLLIPTLVKNPFSTGKLIYKKRKQNSTKKCESLPTSSVSTPTQKAPQQTTSLETAEVTSIQPLPQPLNQTSVEPQSSTASLLIPVTTVLVPLNPESSAGTVEVDKEIKELESKIAELRKRIERLDEMEVHVESKGSPYLISGQLKIAVVNHYKRLCELTGTQPKKKHKVRLTVLPGHPEAPVRCLEEFLNANINDDGDPPFPDLYDVMNCVCRANKQSNMNWTSAQVMKEARALFVQLGRTLQQRRQRREWKDLMCLVKEEVNDPADDDPELMMKLNRNTLIATENENALLEKYSNMEATGLSIEMENEETELSSDKNKKPRVFISNTEIRAFENSTIPNGVSGNPSKNCHVSGTEVSAFENPAVPNGIDGNPSCSYNTQKNARSCINHGNLVAEITSNILNNFGFNRNNNNLDLFSSEFKKFVLGYTEMTETVSNKKANKRFYSNLVSARKTPTAIPNHSSAKSNANDEARNDSKSFHDANDLAKSILELVQQDSVLKNNGDKILLPNPMSSDLDSTPKTVDLKENTHDSFLVFTHTTKGKSTENINTRNKIPSCTPFETNTDKDNGVAPSDKDLPSITDIEGIVKPEPLDIPKMLDELGEDYTTDVFDIEDPFLVIEISDSSESDGEDT